MPADPPAVAAVVSEARAKIGAEATSVLGDVEVLVRRATSLLSVSEALREMRASKSASWSTAKWV
jgi:hypothetical protein